METVEKKKRGRKLKSHPNFTPEMTKKVSDAIKKVYKKEKVHIPKSFEVLCHKINVSIVDTIDRGDSMGEASVNHHDLKVAKKIKYGELSISQQEHTFYHELVHIILQTMNEEELNSNEKFVDVFGGLLYQALKTAKYK